MSLRFQSRNYDNDIDRAAKEARGPGCLFWPMVLFAAVVPAVGFFEGWNRYEQDLTTVFVVFGFVYWQAALYYHEFRIRLNEIDGKVSAIEETVNAMKEERSELIEKLNSIEEKLDSLRYEK
jgi:hypothetical protein